MTCREAVDLVIFSGSAVFPVSGVPSQPGRRPWHRVPLWLRHFGSSWSRSSITTAGRAVAARVSGSLPIRTFRIRMLGIASQVWATLPTQSLPGISPQPRIVLFALPDVYNIKGARFDAWVLLALVLRRHFPGLLPGDPLGQHIVHPCSDFEADSGVVGRPGCGRELTG